jgi:hypothetical protein
MEIKTHRKDNNLILKVRLSETELKIFKNDLLETKGVTQWLDHVVKGKLKVLSSNAEEKRGCLIIDWTVAPNDQIETNLDSIIEVTTNKLNNCKVRMFSAWDREIWKRTKKGFEGNDEEYVNLITGQKDYKDRKAREEDLNLQSKRLEQCIRDINERFPISSDLIDETYSSSNYNDQLVKDIQKFEELIKSAYIEKQKEYGQTMNVGHSCLEQMDINVFYEILVKNNAFPKCDPRILIHSLFDIKMQLFFILEVEMGKYNLIYNEIRSFSEIKDKPLLALKKLSLDQNLIMKNRILWERVMNFIFYLIQGKKFEGKKSKVEKFFKIIENTKWEYLKFYKSLIEILNDRWRTPEVHKGSVLKGLFLRGSLADHHEINEITNVVLNSFWPNLILISKGRNPTGAYLSTPGYR